MNKQRTWPLLLPIASVGLVALFLTITRGLSSVGLQCAFLKITGFYCPGCGGTRCAIALSHGSLTKAWGHNALLATGALIFIVASFYIIVKVTLLGQVSPLKVPQSTTRLTWLIVGVILLFTFLRNTSAFSYLAP